jgi:hypothetical protein
VGGAIFLLGLIPQTPHRPIPSRKIGLAGVVFIAVATFEFMVSRFIKHGVDYNIISKAFECLVDNHVDAL